MFQHTGLHIRRSPVYPDLEGVTSPKINQNSTALKGRVSTIFHRRACNLAPSPVGEGWGEGILRISATFPNNSTTEIQALRLAALSLALSHGREDGAVVGIKASQGKQVM